MVKEKIIVKPQTKEKFFNATKITILKKLKILWRAKFLLLILNVLMTL